MAKSRYKTKKKKARRKRTGRKAAGHRLARYNRLVREIGKKAAYAEVFGGRGYKKKKKGRKGKHHARHSSGGGGGYRRQLFKAALSDIQKQYKTEGWPPTAEERRMAEQVVEAELGSTRDRWGRPTRYVASPEERIRKDAAAQIARLKRNAAARLVVQKMEEERREAKRRMEEEAQREIDRAAASIH